MTPKTYIAHSNTRGFPMSAANVRSFLIRNWIAFAFLAIAFSFVGIPVAGTAAYFGVKAIANAKANSPQGREDARQREKEEMDGYGKNGDNLANSFKVP